MESDIFLIVLGVLLGAVLLYCLVPTAKKGARGERAVHGILRQSLHSSDYAILRDVLLRGEGGVVQIDHVVVSRFGIFVIETRDLPGWIIGSEKDSHWIQSLDETRTEFPNPLRQNQALVRTLQALLELPATKFHPLVVFSNKAEFWKPMPLNVIKLERLLPFIEVRNTQLLTLEEAARAVAKIEFNQLDPETAYEAPQLESLRARNAAAAQALSAAPTSREVREPARPAFGSRLAARALAGVASVALLLVAANVLIGGYSGFTSIDGAWPTIRREQPARQPAAVDAQEVQKAYDPSTLRCGYSLETRRCACFEPDGTKIPMEFEECRTVADESVR